MPRFIKGETYRIDEHPHFYQGSENGVYRFLKWDGSIKYFREDSLGKVKPSKCLEQLQEFKEKADYYMEKYNWYKQKEEEKIEQEKYRRIKDIGWFSENKYVQISTFLSMILVVISSIIIVSKSPAFLTAAFTFIVLLIGGLLISLAVAWGAYKILGHEHQYKGKSEILLTLLFYLPTVWFVLYRLLKFLILLNHDAD